MMLKIYQTNVSMIFRLKMLKLYFFMRMLLNLFIIKLAKYERIYSERIRSRMAVRKRRKRDAETLTRPLAVLLGQIATKTSSLRPSRSKLHHQRW